MALSYAEAYELGKEASAHLRPVLDRLKAVGSLRRKRDPVGDIEFLAVPKFQADLLGGEEPLIQPVRDALLEIGRWVKGRTRQMVITDLYGVTGARLELYLVHPPAAWGSLLAIRTGPGKLGRYVVTVCKRYGYEHKDGYAVRRDTGERVPTDTEEQFFALADVECVAPRKRDALADRLWWDYENTPGFAGGR